MGSWPCKVKPRTILESAYKKYGEEPNTITNSKFKIQNAKIQVKSQNLIYERHRHRYEVNNDYRETLGKAGMVISGTSPDGKLVEAIELPKKTHPFFVGTQFHPEYKSRPLSPHPLFVGFIKAALSK